MSRADEDRRCGFCGLPRSVTGPVVVGGPKGNKVVICGDCCIRATNYLEAKRAAKFQAIDGADQALPLIRLAGTGPDEDVFVE